MMMIRMIMTMLELELYYCPQCHGDEDAAAAD